MTLRIGIVQINVTDLARAWEFYVEILGIRATRSLGEGHAFELDLGGDPRVLVYPVPLVAARDYPRETGVTVVLYTDDIFKTTETWRARGVSFIPISWSEDASGIAPSPFGPFIAFRDPFGNVHELLQPSSGTV